MVQKDDQVVADVRLRVELTEEEKARQAAIAEGKPQENEAQQTPIPEAETKLDNAEIFVRPNGFVGLIPVEKLDELLVGVKAGEKKTAHVEVLQTFFRHVAAARLRSRSTSRTSSSSSWPNWTRTSAVQRREGRRPAGPDPREPAGPRREPSPQRDERPDLSLPAGQHMKFELPMDIVARQAGNILQRQHINLLSRGLSRQQVDEQMEQLRAGSEEQAKEQLRPSSSWTRWPRSSTSTDRGRDQRTHRPRRHPERSATGETERTDGTRRLTRPVPAGSPPEQVHQQTARAGEHRRRRGRSEGRETQEVFEAESKED